MLYSFRASERGPGDAAAGLLRAGEPGVVEAARERAGSGTTYRPTTGRPLPSRRAKAALFQTVDPAGRRLTGRALDRRLVLVMIKRRAAAIRCQQKADSGAELPCERPHRRQSCRKSATRVSARSPIAASAYDSRRCGRDAGGGCRRRRRACGQATGRAVPTATRSGPGFLATADEFGPPASEGRSPAWRRTRAELHRLRN